MLPSSWRTAQHARAQAAGGQTAAPAAGGQAAAQTAQPQKKVKDQGRVRHLQQCPEDAGGRLGPSCYRIWTPGRRNIPIPIIKDDRVYYYVQATVGPTSRARNWMVAGQVAAKGLQTFSQIPSKSHGFYMTCVNIQKARLHGGPDRHRRESGARTGGFVPTYFVAAISRRTPATPIGRKRGRTWIPWPLGR